MAATTATHTEPPADTAVSQSEAAAVFEMSDKTLRKYMNRAGARIRRPGRRVLCDLDRLRGHLVEHDPVEYGGIDVNQRLAHIRSGRMVAGVTERPADPMPEIRNVPEADGQDPQESHAFMILRNAHQERGELVTRLDREVTEARQEGKKRVRRWQIVAAAFVVFTGIVGTVAAWSYSEAVGGRAELAGVRVQLEAMGQTVQAERNRADVAHADWAIERDRSAEIDNHRAELLIELAETKDLLSQRRDEVEVVDPLALYGK